MLAVFHILSWIALERAVTAHAQQASIYIGGAAAIAGFCAAAAAHVLRRRPYGGRLAAAIIILVVGTVGLASLFMAMEIIFLDLSVHDVSWPIYGLIVAFSGAGALYVFLSVAGNLLVVPAVPLVLACAAFLARKPR